MLPFVVLGALSALAAAHAVRTPRLDSGLDRIERGAVRTALREEKDPRMLRAFAETLSERGFPRAAHAVTTRAEAIDRPDLPSLDLSSYPLEYWFGSYRS